MVPFINTYPVDGDLWEVNGITTVLKVIFLFLVLSHTRDSNNFAQRRKLC